MEKAIIPFNADTTAEGYWEVFHDDDCGVVFDWFGGGKCPACGFRPDMQSIGARRTSKEYIVNQDVELWKK